MNAEERLAKIRSVIRETEEALDKINCDQLSLLRSAFLEIILAAGPQGSGRRRHDDQADRQKRTVQDLRRGDSYSLGSPTGSGKLGGQRGDSVSGRAIRRKDLDDPSKAGRRAVVCNKRDQSQVDQDGSPARGTSAGKDPGRVRSIAEAVRSVASRKEREGQYQEVPAGSDIDRQQVQYSTSFGESGVEGRIGSETEAASRGYTALVEGLPQAAKDFGFEEDSAAVVPTPSEPIEEDHDA